MGKWIKNGCSLAWLINPEDKTVSIYRKDGTIDKVTGFDKTISGEDLLPGFELDLSILKDWFFAVNKQKTLVLILIKKPAF